MYEENSSLVDVVVRVQGPHEQLRDARAACEMGEENIIEGL